MARSFINGFSLERCALYCRGAMDAVAFAAQLDLCTCLSADTLSDAQSACERLLTLARFLPTPSPFACPQTALLC